MGHYSDSYDYETPEQIAYKKDLEKLEKRMERLLLAALITDCDNDKDLVLAKKMASGLVHLMLKDSGVKYSLTRVLK